MNNRWKGLFDSCSSNSSLFLACRTTIILRYLFIYIYTVYKSEVLVLPGGAVFSPLVTTDWV